MWGRKQNACTQRTLVALRDATLPSLFAMSGLTSYLPSVFVGIYRCFVGPRGFAFCVPPVDVSTSQCAARSCDECAGLCRPCDQDNLFHFVSVICLPLFHPGQPPRQGIVDCVTCQRVTLTRTQLDQCLSLGYRRASARSLRIARSRTLRSARPRLVGSPLKGLNLASQRSDTVPQCSSCSSSQ